jgi:MFS family permease
LTQMTMVVCLTCTVHGKGASSFQVTWAIASGTAPVVGGVLAQRIGWPWIFRINLPMAAIASVSLLLTLDVHNPRSSVKDGAKAVDWLGALYIVGLTAMLLVGLDFGGKIYPWSSAKLVCLLVFGAVIVVPFKFAEKKLARHPLMPLRLFRDGSNAAAIAVSAAAFFVSYPSTPTVRGSWHLS